MHRLSSLFVVAVLMLLSACSSVTINTDYAIDNNFTAYKTYAWHPGPPMSSRHLDEMGGDIFNARVRRAVDQTLSSKGFTKSDKPDFYVNYNVVTEQRMSIDSYNTYAGYGPGWGWYGPGWGWYGNNVQTTVRYYTQGTLILDMIDAKTGKLVWRGTAAGPINEAKTPQKRVQQIDETIQRMLANFPPQRTGP